MIGKLITVAMAVAVFVFMVLFGTLMGALSGWVVGWFFADTILTFFSYLFGASHPLQMWELGASLGFISGFLSVRVKSSGVSGTALKDWWGKRRALAEAEFLTDPRQPIPPTKPTIVRG